MHITSGKLKNKKILTKTKSTHQPNYRPTSARTRLAVFNIIENSPYISDNFIKNSKVLDLFSGSGAFGFEALSHGAGYVTFVDESQEQLKLIMQNAELLNLEDSVSIIRSKAQSLSMANKQYNLVYLDPPYGKKLVTETLKVLINNGWLDEKCLIIAEHDKYEAINLPNGLQSFDTRSYGKTCLTFITRGE